MTTDRTPPPATGDQPPRAGTATPERRVAGASLELRDLRKRFGGVQAVDGVSLSIGGDELVSLLGPSGCGKTTTLRLIGGLERPDSGAILVDGVDVSELPARNRGMGFVFQAYALFPNMTGAENIAYGLRVRNRREADIRRVVDRLVELTRLGDAATRYPHQLSGGQQQRVALARALAIEPRILLLDEPLAALDASVRVALRTEIRRVQLELRIPTVYVTHDQEEAMSISDRVVVMHEGRVVQDGPPETIYRTPADAGVATFVGAANRLEAVAGPEPGTVTWQGHVLPVAGDLGRRPGERVVVIVRPERIRLLGAGEDGPAPALEGVVTLRSFLGVLTRFSVLVEGITFLVDVVGLADIAAGDRVRLAFPPEAALVYAAADPGGES